MQGKPIAEQEIGKQLLRKPFPTQKLLFAAEKFYYTTSVKTMMKKIAEPVTTAYSRRKNSKEKNT